VEDRRTDFYFYFPDQPAAERAAEELRASGFDVTVRLGGDDVNWLALAQKEVDEEEFDRLDQEFTRVAPGWGAEYDGYERPVRDA
jgi:hypothetical protein